LSTFNQSIQPGESKLMTLGDLLEQHLVIPQFQRPYDWESQQVADLIADLREAHLRQIPLFLGLVVVHSTEEGLAVIDGQQRLTTLMLALAALDEGEKVLRSKEGGPMQLWLRPRLADVNFTRSLLRGRDEPPTTLSQWRMKSAKENLSSVDQFKIDTVLQCELILYVAPSLAGATRLFERINLRGKKVGQFDLVKNKLIEWVSLVKSHQHRSDLEKFITSKYDDLYKLLDPQASDQPFDSDKLLKVHWILFHDAQFKSTDRVLNRLEQWVDAEMARGENFSTLVEKYLDSLYEVAAVWVYVERPFVVPYPALGEAIKRALLDFAKLEREGELQPLLVAALLRLGPNALKLIKFCEIHLMRAALAKKQSNHGRSGKWRLARQVFNNSLKDGTGKTITTAEEIVHQIFWMNTPWWDKEETVHLGYELTKEALAIEVLPRNALTSPDFWGQYRDIIHYLFWEYGRFLISDKTWKDKVRVDINPFQESVWFQRNGEAFRDWDIEHIYPQNADDRQEREGSKFRAQMQPWIHHLGNLTVLPIHDNRSMQNAPFVEKLSWMLEQKKVPFNELLADRTYTGKLMDRPHWGPNNCRKRLEQILEFCDFKWGSDAVKAFGVGPYDERIIGYVEPEDDDA
jgi:hypothetical protein